MQIQSLGQEDNPKEEMAAHSSILAWRIPWAIRSMEFYRPEYWSRLPFPFPRGLPNPGIKSRFPALQADSLLSEASGKPIRSNVSFRMIE